MRVQLLSALAVVTALCSVLMHAQGLNVPVPSTCSPQVNAKLQTMLQEHPKGYVENVMACGISAGTRVNSGGKHGSHHIITVNVKLPDGQAAKIQIAINDSLDGVVSAKPGDSVFAYGEGYTTGGLWVAGIHDVHCSTHPTADNGWVVVNGNKTPKSCPTRRSRN